MSHPTLLVEIEAGSETEGARNRFDTHVAGLRVQEDGNTWVVNTRKLESKRKGRQEPEHPPAAQEDL